MLLWVTVGIPRLPLSPEAVSEGARWKISSPSSKLYSWEGKRQGGSKRNMKTDLAAVVTGDTSRGRTQFTNTANEYPFFCTYKSTSIQPRTDRPYAYYHEQTPSTSRCSAWSRLKLKDSETPPKWIRNNYDNTQQLFLNSFHWFLLRFWWNFVGISPIF